MALYVTVSKNIYEYLWIRSHTIIYCSDGAAMCIAAVQHWCKLPIISVAHFAVLISLQYKIDVNNQLSVTHTLWLKCIRFELILIKIHLFVYGLGKY
jgi:hypothetical protein